MEAEPELGDGARLRARLDDIPHLMLPEPHPFAGIRLYPESWLLKMLDEIESAGDTGAVRSPQPRKCPACRGTGVVTKTYDEYGMADPKDVPCGVCNGCGSVVPAEPPRADPAEPPLD